MSEDTTDPIDPISRRDFLGRAATAAAMFAFPGALEGCGQPRNEAPLNSRSNADEARLRAWSGTLRQEGVLSPVGQASVRVGELAIGTPYKAFTLEAYIKAGGDPEKKEPLTLSLTEFDCVSLVEACLGVARAADDKPIPSWGTFAREVERMRYRSGERGSYSTDRKSTRL